MMTKRGPDVVSFAPGDPAAPDVAYGYLPPEQIEEIAHKVFDGLARDNNLAGLRTRPGVFVDRLAYHWNLVNSVHSFREGNTRTQFAFFHQLSDSVGFRIDTEAFKPGGPLRVDFVLARYHGQATGEHTRLREVLGRAITEKPGPPVWAPTRSLSQMLDHARNVRPHHAARIPIPPPDHRRDRGNQVGL
jgi:cell filamentation protein